MKEREKLIHPKGEESGELEIEGVSAAELNKCFRRLNAFIRSHNRKADYTGETRWQGEIKFFMKVLVRFPLERKDVTQYYPIFTKGVSKLLDDLKKNESGKDLPEWFDYKNKYSNIHIAKVVYEHLRKNFPDHQPKLAKTMAGIIGDLQDKLIYELQKEKIEFFTNYNFRIRRKEKLKEIVTLFFEGGYCEC
ncbi:MAG: hypothetical protein RML72_05280 [Bacteroidia bacterium]|nr:hypothetical protein [Bacteroidia bacterium]